MLNLGTVSVLRLVIRAIRKLLPRDEYLMPILSRILQLIDFFYPKNHSIIVFGSNGGTHLSGSPRALFEYIMNHKTGFIGYYLQQRPIGINQISAFSLHGLSILLGAKTLVSSHGLNDFSFFRPSRRKFHICTWHGIMLKSSGYLCELTERETRKITSYVSSVDAVLSASYFDASTVNLAYNHGGLKMKLTGHPRNDQLLKNQSSDKSRLKEFIPWIEENEKIVMYAPTFRDRAMGPNAMKIPIMPLSDFNEEEFFAFLENNNIVFLLRMHIDDSISRLELDNNRIVHFGFDVCPDINYILGDIDALITDYSSIAWDFLLLDRPIIFIPYDFEAFSKVRGFIIDDYDFWIPGPKVSSMRDFLCSLAPVIGEGQDEYVEKRKELRKVIHSHQTESSIMNVLRLIREKSDK